VVVIDGLEALLALDADLSAADAALARLFELSPAVRLVTTLRADCAARLGALPKASARLNASATRYVLGPLTSSGLREAIHGPAALAGRRVDPDLVTRLILDASRSEGSLPLLAHVLRSMWERSDGDRLTLDDYDAIGHLGGALSAGADRLLERLPEGWRLATRRALLSLCTVDASGRALRRRGAIDDVIASTGLPASDAWTLVDRLSTGSEDGLRLLRILPAGDDAPEGAQVELVHEALIDAWGTLAGWVREEALALRARHDLVASAHAWQAAGAPEDGVARGAQLAYYEGAGRVEGVGARFLAASRAARDRAHRDRSRRRAVALAALVAVSGALSGLVGWGLRERAEGERRRQRGLDAAQRLAGAIDTQLSALPGAVEARAQLIETAESLVEELDPRPDTLSSRGALLYQRGRLARGRGEHASALEDLRAAADAQRAVVDRLPSLEAELSLARTLELLHWQHLTLRDHVAALNAAVEMGARLEAARARGLDDVGLAVLHARADKLMARVYELEVGSEAALAHYRRSLARLQRLPGADAEAARDNVRACIGNMELIQGDYEAARRSYRDALQATLNRTGAFPDSLVGRRDLLWLWLGLGRIELEAGEPRAAQEDLRQALRLGRRNVEAEPGLDAVYGIDLATVLHELAHAEVEVGAFADAEAHAREAEQIARGLAAAEPLRHGIILARARSAQARLALARGRFDDALGDIDVALDAFEAPAGRRAGNQHTVIIHARLLLTRAGALDALGRAEAARATRDRVAEIVGPVFRRDPLDHQAADAMERAAPSEPLEDAQWVGRSVKLGG
jgi:tetratricopeptide (TPR) repeat protein